MADFLDEKRKEIQDRLRELKPAVDEYQLLLAADQALGGLSNGATKPTASKASAAPTARRKSGAPRFTARDRSCSLPPAGCSPTAVGIVSRHAPDAAALAAHAGPTEVDLSAPRPGAGGPPPAGIREPRRPAPTAGTGAAALPEPTAHP